MKYKFRYLKPDDIATEWIEAEGTSEIDAIQENHLRCNYGAVVKLSPNEGTVRFAIVETESGERLISRVFWCGIGRKGGVVPNPDPFTYEAAAKKLGVPVEKLTDPTGWDGEETEWHRPWR